MFGSYSVCNIIVLLNMLIAMMSNSYTAISDKSDTEWKFARSKYCHIQGLPIQIVVSMGFFHRAILLFQ